MKTNVTSWALFFCLLVVQLMVTNYVHLSQFVVISILPALIMCLPMSLSSVWVMLIAFATGLSVDLLAEGVVGLNALALVPVAAARKLVVGAICGNDVVERGSDFNFKKNGVAKVSVIILLPLMLYLLIYIAADGAGMRPFWFNAGRFIASTLCDLVLCMLAVKALNPDDRR